jgi:plastocyanin
MMKLLMTALALLLGTQAAAAEDVSILIKNFDFGPMNVTVAPGTTVVWKNLDGEPHTVASADGLFRSQALDQNDSFRFTFDKAGTFRYICSIHPNMKATITVK